MENGKVNKALKLLGSSEKGGILPLTEETIEMILENILKHLKHSMTWKKKMIKKYILY